MFAEVNQIGSLVMNISQIAGKRSGCYIQAKNDRRYFLHHHIKGLIYCYIQFFWKPIIFFSKRVGIFYCFSPGNPC